MSFPLSSTDPLGTDIVLDQNGDIVVNISGSLQTVSDEHNVEQAMRVLLTTATDTYLWDDDIGSPLVNYVDQPISPQMEQEITSIVKEQILKDSRIISVNDVNIDGTSTPDTLIIFVAATVSVLGNLTIPIIITGGV